MQVMAASLVLDGRGEASKAQGIFCEQRRLTWQSQDQIFGTCRVGAEASEKLT
jgi:hypothetical protein